MNERDPVSAYRPLGRPPEATTATVTKLIDKAVAGEIRVPAFQRPLRWQSADVVKLFDSLWLGYPAGSLLVWAKPAGADAVRIGGATIEAPASPEAWFVVDGQQRLTALTACLHPFDHGRDRRWRVWFDPDAPGFRGAPPPPECAHRWVPGHVLGSRQRLTRWQREHELDDTALQRIDEAQERILGYTFPIYVVRGDDEGALRAAFSRLNSTGRQLRADEVFTALLDSPEKGTRQVDLAALEIACNLDGFGAPARGDILKALLSMSGFDPSRRLQDLPDDALAQLVDQDAAEFALTRTVRFLMDRCDIPSIRLVPYPVVLSILSRWFHIFPDTDPAVEDHLARWLWRGAISGVHQRAEVSRMRHQVDAIQEGSLASSLRALQAEVAGPIPRTWDLRRFNTKSAHSRIEVLALRHRRPAEPTGPLSDAVLMSQDRIAKEIIAIPACRDLEPHDQALAKTAANRVLLTDGHTGLARELRSWDPALHREALRSHLIDEEAFDALLRDDVPAFLRSRATAVRACVEAYLAKQAEIERPRLAPRGAYLEPSLEPLDEPPDSGASELAP